MVDGTHFRLGAGVARATSGTARSPARSRTSPRWARGPGEAYLGGGAARRSCDDADVLALHEGAEALAAATGTTIAGGDLPRGPVL